MAIINFVILNYAHGIWKISVLNKLNVSVNEEKIVKKDGKKIINLYFMKNNIDGLKKI